MEKREGGRRKGGEKRERKGGEERWKERRRKGGRGREGFTELIILARPCKVNSTYRPYRVSPSVLLRSWYRRQRCRQLHSSSPRRL